MLVASGSLAAGVNGTRLLPWSPSLGCGLEKGKETQVELAV